MHDVRPSGYHAQPKLLPRGTFLGPSADGPRAPRRRGARAQVAKKAKTSSGEKPAERRRPITTNRKARYEYELIDRWEAGIRLTGSEVKSCRLGKVNLNEAWVRVRDGQAWLVSCHVAPYENAGYAQHDPLRERRLLLHRREIARMEKAVQQAGLTAVPTQVYFLGSLVKVEVAVGRGKKLHDKRESVKARALDRQARSLRDI